MAGVRIRWNNAPKILSTVPAPSEHSYLASIVRTFFSGALVSFGCHNKIPDWVA